MRLVASWVVSLGVLGVLLPPVLSAASKEDPRDPATMATVGSARITASQLDEAARERLVRLRMEEYNIKRPILDRMVEDELLRAEAARQRVDVAQLILTEVDGKARPVTEEEKLAVYAKNPGPETAKMESLSRIEANLRQQHVSERRRQFIADLKAKTDVHVFLQPVRVTIDLGAGQSRGPMDAPVTIVEFSDFQCPYCARAQPVLKRIDESYGKNVRFVLRNYPLPFHAEATKAAEAALCAADQGRFWEMHDRMFSNQSRLRVADLKNGAAEMGLEAPMFDQCLDSGRHQFEVKKDLADGSRYGVTGTPAFFINGRLLSGAQPFESFAQIIDDELSRMHPRGQ